MQRYTVYLYLETALHVSGCTTTHHQERIQLYLHHLLFVMQLLQLCRYRGRVGTRLSVLWVAYATHSTLKPAVTVRQIPDAVDTVVCSPDDGWWYHSKHVE